MRKSKQTEPLEYMYLNRMGGGYRAGEGLNNTDDRRYYLLSGLSVY